MTLSKRRGKIGTVLGLSLLSFGVLLSSGSAYEFTVGGKPVSIMGYISQEADYGLVKNKFENQSGFNSFLTTALVEVEAKPSRNVSAFVSGSFEADWAYDILKNNNQWNDKLFDRSRDHQYIRDDWQDLLKEAHVTYGAEHVYLRLGKQVVQWGETDGFVLANLINPVDQRRGPTDVKFEHTIIPIWLVRAEYNTKVNSTVLQDLGLQFILDPALQFRGNQIVEAGNDRQGVFAPGVDLGAPVHLGSLHSKIDRPDNLDPKDFSYGLKLKGNIRGTLVNLLYFNGRDRDFAAHPLPIPPTVDPIANGFDGLPVIHPFQEGEFPKLRFVGLTASGAFEGLKASFLGGVAPVLRLEAIYAFDTTYGTNEMFDPAKFFWKTDELRLALGVDWKVKINWLNPRAYFFISPQYFYQRELDFPDSGDVANALIGGQPLTVTQRGSVPPALRENNHKSTLVVMTSYLHNKLAPLFFWSHDYTNQSDTWLGKLTYSPTQSWDLGLGVFALKASARGIGNDAMKNHDKLFATVTYKFQ
ncbi:MAG: DUF1302 family protein [Deltaproteobacteria bacterium]|nr:DUF1302 family protein [Deltaproteobacteria bacterium]